MMHKIQNQIIRKIKEIYHMCCDWLYNEKPIALWISFDESWAFIF